MQEVLIDFWKIHILLPLSELGFRDSLIGAPGNMIAQSALEPLGLKFGFFEYAIVGLPILIVGILFYATIGFKILPHHDTTDADDSIFEGPFLKLYAKVLLSLVKAGYVTLS